VAWLSVWGEMQICKWPSWCHCHSLPLAPVNPFWYWLTRVVPDKWPLNGCCCMLTVKCWPFFRCCVPATRNQLSSKWYKFSISFYSIQRWSITLHNSCFYLFIGDSCQRHAQTQHGYSCSLGMLRVFFLKNKMFYLLNNQNDCELYPHQTIMSFHRATDHLIITFSQLHFGLLSIHKLNVSEWQKAYYLTKQNSCCQ